MRSASLLPAWVAAASTALAACSGSGGRAPATSAAAVGGSNALRVTVNGPLCAPAAYVDEPCVEVTVCTPDQAACQVVTGVLLDTGSYGLRVFQQALSIDLPAVAAGGGVLATCARFGSGQSDWGPVRRAAVILGGEPAVTVPIQVIDAAFGPPPGACGPLESSPSAAGFNGILGVGPLVEDCGPGCAASASNGVYFACGAAGCAGVAAPGESQVKNPAALLAGDGNGLRVHLPAVPASGAPSAEGEVRFGVGTRTDNAPGAVTALSLDAAGELGATLMGQGWSAFLDTGSNGIFITPPNGVTSLPACPSPLQDWFCPASVQVFPGSATGAAGGPTIPFELTVASLQALLAATPSNAVFGSIGGAGLGAGLLDLGLPFHLGRDVWIGFEGRSTPLGTGPLVGW